MSKVKFHVWVPLTFLIVIVSLMTYTSSQDATASVEVSNEAPVVTSVTTYDQDGAPTDGDYSPGAFSNYSINCSAAGTDANSGSDIDTVFAALYHSGKSSNNAADDDDVHYTNSSCEIYDVSGVDFSANCSFDIGYWADDGAALGTNHWICNVTAWDGAFNGSNYANLTIGAQRGFNVSSAIGFGSMDLGETSSSGIIANVGNLGNDGIDVMVNSTNMSCSTGEIWVDNIRYNVSDDAWAVMCTLTEDNPETCDALNVSFDLIDCADSCGAFYTNKDTYWRIAIPSSGVDGSCSSTITFTSKDGEDPDT